MNERPPPDPEPPVEVAASCPVEPLEMETPVIDTRNLERKAAKIMPSMDGMRLDQEKEDEQAIAAMELLEKSMKSDQAH